MKNATKSNVFLLLLLPTVICSARAAHQHVEKPQVLQRFLLFYWIPLRIINFHNCSNRYENQCFFNNNACGAMLPQHAPATCAPSNCSKTCGFVMISGIYPNTYGTHTFHQSSMTSIMVVGIRMVWILLVHGHAMWGWRSSSALWGSSVE